MKRLVKFLLLFLFVFLVVSVVIRFYGLDLAECIGDYCLVVRDTPRKMDVIIVLSGGSDNERIDWALRLWEKGLAKKLILTGDLLTANLSSVDLWQQIALGNGVNKENIVLHRNSTSTYQSAFYCADALKKKNILAR